MDYSPPTSRRAPPPPIRIAQSNSSYGSHYGPTGRRGSAATLLADISSASPRKIEYGTNRYSQSRITASSPPEEFLYSIPSPGSPPVRVSRSTTPQLVNPRYSNRYQSPPPPPPRTRGSMSLPPAPTQKELDDYEALCRAAFFGQDENAKASLLALKSRIPQPHQAKYNRLENNVRHEFHITTSLRKISEFRAHLTSIQPGCSLSPAARVNPGGALARRERNEKFQNFVESQCGSAGTQNFFIGLHAAMKLQTLPPSIGGTGEGRIEWEIDDAVFMESGGNQFMVDAIDMMKGVLGFDERPLNCRPLPCRSFRHRPSRSSPTNVLSSPRDRGEEASQSEATNIRPRAAPLGRSRAPSDPFLDPTRSSPSMHAPLSMAFTTPEESSTDLDSLGPSTPRDDRGPDIPPPASLLDSYPASTYSMDAEAFLNEPQLRVWIFPPYITNPELYKLMAMLPSSITGQTVPRFKPLAKSKPRKGRRKGADIDLEGEGNPMQLGADIPSIDDVVRERGEIRKGTGRMWIGDMMRLPGWRGTLWDVIRDWFRHLFG